MKLEIEKILIRRYIQSSHVTTLIDYLDRSCLTLCSLCYNINESYPHILHIQFNPKHENKQ